MTQPSEYIEGIDGSINIVIRRRSNEVVIVFGGVEARLSIDDAFRLAYLLQSNASKPVPSEDKPEPVQPSMKIEPVRSSGKIRRYRETISDLMEEGLIMAGAGLTIKYKYMERSGTVTEDGKIEIDGYKEETPSAAGQRVTGKSCNGWQEWRVYDGSRLADLRWMLRAKRFPGENHRYAESTAREKQQIAIGWVDYALARGLDPGKKSNAKTEAYLADRQLKSDYRYTDSTLNVYRGHLRQWFNYYGGD